MCATRELAYHVFMENLDVKVTASLTAWVAARTSTTSLPLFGSNGPYVANFRSVLMTSGWSEIVILYYFAEWWAAKSAGA